jgi:hypothetical protein
MQAGKEQRRKYAKLVKMLSTTAVVMTTDQKTMPAIHLTTNGTHCIPSCCFQVRNTFITTCF